MKTKALYLIFFLPFVSLAQSNFKSGYVIGIKGDTLRGYINYKEWGRNPNDINFKTSVAEKARRYGLADINGFQIDGYVIYSKYTVNISLNKIDIASPPAFSDTSYVTETVFLKTIQKGPKATLYAYRDNIKERFFIQDNTMPIPTELLYGIYQDPNSFSNVIDKNTFRLQLAKLAQQHTSDASILIAYAQQANYKEDDLTNFLERLNGNPQTKNITARHKKAIRFFAGAAYSSSTLKYSANGPYYDPQPSAASTPKIIIGVDALANANIGHLVFRLEMAYSINNFTIIDKPNPIYNVAAYDENLIKLKQNVIAITPQAIYNIYNADKLKLFIDVGYSVNAVSYSTTKITVVQKGQPASSTSKVKTDGDLNGSYTTFQFKAGALLNKHLEIYYSYFPNAEITKSATYSTSLKSTQFGLTYIF